MLGSTETSAAQWPMLLFIGGIGVVVAGMLGISYVLGQHHRERATGEPYESGIVSTGSARVRLVSDFFLVAILFVIFDLESVFIYAWSISIVELGWRGFAEISVFIGMFLAALVYLWRGGGLDF